MMMMIIIMPNGRRDHTPNKCSEIKTFILVIFDDDDVDYVVVDDDDDDDARWLDIPK